MLKYIIYVFAIIDAYVMSTLDVQTEMLADVIKSYNKPSFVVAHLCWTPRKKQNLMRCLSKNENPVAIKFVNEESLFKIRTSEEHNIIFLIEVHCNTTIDVLERANASRKFRFPFRWLIIDKVGSHKVPKELEPFELLIDAEVVIAKDVGNRSYSLQLVYKIGILNPLRSENFGSWDLEKRYQKSTILQNSTSMRRRNLEGYPIPTVYVSTHPYAVKQFEDRLNPMVDTMSKVNYHTSNNLLASVNASRHFVNTSSLGYYINGTWNGLIGYLSREEVELGGTPVFLTEELIDVVDFLACPTTSPSKFVFQQPNLSYENNLFLLSFRTSVWYCCLVLMLLIFVILFLVAVWEWKNENEIYETREIDPTVLRPYMADIVIFVLGSTCQQGSPTELKGSLGRVVMLVIFLSLMFLFTSYSANIVALLQSSSNQIQSLEDLLHSRLKCGVHDTEYNKHQFSKESEPVRKAIYQKKVAPPSGKPKFMSLEEGVKNMQKGLFAFHMEIGIGYMVVSKYFQDSEKCRLKEIQYLYSLRYDPWLTVRKKSPYKEILKVGMARIREHGIQERENLLMYEKRPKCYGGGASFVSVSMVDCYPVMLVLLYGMAGAWILLLAELLYHRRSGAVEKIKRSIEVLHES